MQPPINNGRVSGLYCILETVITPVFQQVYFGLTYCYDFSLLFREGRVILQLSKLLVKVIEVVSFVTFMHPYN